MHDYITPLSPLLLISTGFTLLPHSARGAQIRAELLRHAHDDGFHSCGICVKPASFSISLFDPRRHRSPISSGIDLTGDQMDEEIALKEAVKYGVSMERTNSVLPYGSPCDLLLMATLTKSRPIRREEFDAEFDEIFGLNGGRMEEPIW